MVGVLLPGFRMHILKELEAFPNYSFTLLKVELVLEVGDPGIGTGAADKDKGTLLEVAWAQFSGGANGEPITRVSAQAQQRIDYYQVRIRR